MMTMEDYAQDVGKTIEEIKALCEKVGIDYEDENTLLDDVSITLLDNAIEEDDVEESTEEQEERRLQEEVEDKAEELAYNTKIDLEDTTSFTKVKQNKQAKKIDNKKELSVLEQAKKSKILEKRLECEIEDSVYEEIKNIIEK